MASVLQAREVDAVREYGRVGVSSPSASCDGAAKAALRVPRRHISVARMSKGVRLRIVNKVKMCTLAMRMVCSKRVYFAKAVPISSLNDTYTCHIVYAAAQGHVRPMVPAIPLQYRADAE